MSAAAWACAFRHHLLALRFGPIQLGFDFFGIGDALGNLPPALFQHNEDALIGEFVEHGAYNSETDDLCAEVRPIHTESAGDLCDLSFTLLGRE
jgi:hypothetical protein